MDDAEDFNNQVVDSVATIKKSSNELRAVAFASDEGATKHNRGNHTMWAVAGDQYFPCETTAKTLPPGQYLTAMSQQGIYFQKKSVNLDSLLTLPDSGMQRVLSSMEYFWEREAAFREHGFLWKRGIMIYGPPGGGKTSLLQQLSQRIIDRGGIALYSTAPALDAEGLRVLRKIEPTRPIVMMIEDIDAVTERHGESDLLAMLDGELQVDNIVFIATTNYPGRLDKRLVNRPSRFDEVIRIGMPSSEARLTYLLAKNPRLKNEPEKAKLWVDSTDGLSLAHLRELIVSVECLGNDPEVTMKRLKTMNSVKLPMDAEEAEKRTFGFTNDAGAPPMRGSR